MEDKNQATEEGSTVDAAVTPPNGEVKLNTFQEPLKVSVITDELNVSAKKETVTENPTETKKIAEVKDNSESNDKGAAEPKDTDKQETSNEVAAQDGEKNGDSLILTADDLDPVLASPKKSNPENTVSGIDGAEQNQTDATLLNPTPTTATDPSDAPDKIPQKNQRVIWVSNISKTIKATDLKQYLSKAGKVMAAKIVTDGKCCFGYILMENANDASECIKTLNNADFDGKKLLLSFNKPTKVGYKSGESCKNEIKKPNEVLQNQRGSDTKRAEKRRHSSSKHSTDKSKQPKAKTNTEKTDAIPKQPLSRSHSPECYFRAQRDLKHLQRHLLLEKSKNHEAKLRQIEIDEKHRLREVKLEQDRRKLELDKQFFKTQKREWARINDEKRKLERDRFEVDQQKAKLDEDMKKERMKRKSPNVIFNGMAPKIEPPKKSFKMPKRDEYVNPYNCPAPPAPKLGIDFVHAARKMVERKLDRIGARKFEVIERKFYGDESAERKKHYSHKPEFEEDKQYMKRYPSERNAEHRTQRSPPITYDQVVGLSAPHYQEPSSSQQFGGGPSRAPGYYYHPSQSSQEFTRYDQAYIRKY